MSLSTFEIYSVRFNSVDNSQASYDNGVYILDQTLHSRYKYDLDIVTKQLSNYIIGKRPGNNTTLNGEIAELIIFDQPLEDDEMSAVHAYLSKKWGLESIVDSDGDGHTDDAEETAGTSAIDASDFPMPDFSDTVDTQIGEASSLDSVESNLKLWLDASNIDMLSNSTLSDGDAISEWKDLSGNGYDATQTVVASQPVMNIVDGKEVIVGNSTSRTMTLTDPLNYGTDDITLFVVASKTNGTQDYMFGDAGVPAGAPSIISGYNGLDFEFFGSSPRVTFKDSGSVGLQLLAINTNAGTINFNGQVIETGTNDAFNNKQLDTLLSANGSVGFYDGTIAELLVFNNQLNEAETTFVQYYLSKKCGA